MFTNKGDVIHYVAERAPQFGVDPAAMLAVANQEGLRTTPGSAWVVPGESYNSFGPPSWNGDPRARGGPIIAAHPNDYAAWAWSPEGIDEWIRQVAQVAGGLTGGAAIQAIVTKFEAPREDLVQGEISDATRLYSGFQQQIQGIIPIPGTLPPQIPIPLPGQPSNPQSPVNVKDPTQPTTVSTAVPFSLRLFTTPLGPINFTLPWDFSGILLFLAAIFMIIIGALLWDKTRNVIVKGAEVGAMAA